MVIISSKEGQVGNRLWHASSFMVNAKTHGYSVRYIYFDEFKKYFSESLKENRKQFPARFGITGIKFIDSILLSALSVFMRVCLKAGLRNILFAEIILDTDRALRAKEFDLNDPVFVGKAKRKCVFAYGWLFRDNENFNELSEEVRKLWTPDKKYLDQVNKTIVNARKNSDVIIGIHVRRGDYKRFNDGIWYYDLDTYKRIMKQFFLLDDFRSKKIAFLVCSNEKTDESVFEEFDVITGERHFIEDLYGLAGCDYIVGPPSTFSMWASFYGKVPLLQVKEKNQQVRMEDFKIMP